MSGDPERLLSASSGADPLERELLGSVRHVGPPSDAKERAWRGIAGQIAVVAAVGAASSSTAAAASKASLTGFASWALSTKVAAVALAGSLAAGSGYVVLRTPDAPPSVGPRAVVAPVTRVIPPSNPVAPQPAEVVAPLPAAPVEDVPIRRPEAPRPDLLRAESALLTQARAQLRSGRPAAAQGSLDKLQQQFPKGMLTQEREVLAIEVLSARGNVEGAKRRAKAFVKQYPRSPHSAKLSRFLD
jgi:hypothetical protein